jgi:hypothetical protein
MPSNNSNRLTLQFWIGLMLDGSKEGIHVYVHDYSMFCQSRYVL